MHRLYSVLCAAVMLAACQKDVVTPRTLVVPKSALFAVSPKSPEQALPKDVPNVEAARAAEAGALAAIKAYAPVESWPKLSELLAQPNTRIEATPDAHLSELL